MLRGVSTAMRPAVLALVILSLGAAGFGAAQFLEARRLRSDAAAWDKERAELQQRLAALQKQNAGRPPRMPTADELRPDDRPPSSAGANEEAPTPVPPPNGANPVFRRGNEARMAMDVMNSPEVQRLMSIQQKAALDGRYAALFRNLALNPAQLERLKELLVEKQAAVMDVMASAQAQGMLNRDNRGELRELVNETQAEIDSMIRAEIGERGYSQYKNYESTLPYRGTVDQLERRLSYSDSPLQPAQAEQIAQILAETAPQRRTGGPAVIGGAVNFVTATTGGNVVSFGGNISNDALVRAQGVLQPAQLETLRTLQQEQAAAQQLAQQMREARSRVRNAPATPAAPGTPVPPPQPKG